MHQLEIDWAPQRTRRGDCATSMAGARKCALRAGTFKAALLDAFKAHPAGLTADEAARYANLPAHACYWKRVGELERNGHVRITGDTRAGICGVPRMVYAAVAR